MTDGQILTFWRWAFRLNATSALFNGLGYLLFGFETIFGIIGLLCAWIAYFSWNEVERIFWR